MEESRDWKVREKERRREEVLLAAERCFARKNYHECTMDDIAREFSCSVGSIYKIFSSKQEVFRAIFAMRAEKLSQFVDNFKPQSEEPVQAISDFIMASINNGLEDRESIQVFLRNRVHEEFVDESMWHESFMPVVKRLYGILEKYLRKGIEQGIFRDDLPMEMVVRMFEKNIFFILDEVCAFNCVMESSTSYSIEQWRDLFIELFVYGLKKR